MRGHALPPPKLDRRTSPRQRPGLCPRHSCFEAKTGKAFYQQVRLPKPYNFKASPVGANGKLYLASEEGDVIVVRMGEKFEVLATNTLKDQTFIATPAILDGNIYLRGQNTLYCVRQSEP